MTSHEDKKYMQLACELALKGEGYVEPNPMVGCVLVRDGRILSQGFHGRFGGPHAERVALAALPPGAARGATAYVTLEPCCHHGKTPPCTEALIKAGIARLCCAMLDPFPKVGGQGAQQLRDAGIAVDVLGADESPASEILAPYLKRLATQLPFVIAKWAMSLDGKMATRTGDSRWISGPESRAHSHQIRGRMDAIIVGSRTARIDDPLLTARPSGARTPLRVVIDSLASLPTDSQLVRTAAETPVLIWTSPNTSPEKVASLRASGCRIESFSSDADRLTELMRFLVAEYQATNVLVEGGGQLLGHLFDLDLIDQYNIYIAPKIIGGSQATVPCCGMGLATVAEGPGLTVMERQTLGEDLFLRVRRAR